MADLIQTADLVTRLGFPCVMALLFWRYIATTQAKTNELLQKLIDRVDTVIEVRK